MLQGNSYFEKATTNTAPHLKKTPRLLHQKESTPKHAAYSEHTLRGEDATTNLLLPQQKTKTIYIPHEKNTYLRTRNRTPTHQSRITPYGGQTLHHDHIRQYDGNAPTRPEAKKNLLNGILPPHKIPENAAIADHQMPPPHHKMIDVSSTARRERNC